jgi:large conductance mechanosensitive channel
MTKEEKKALKEQKKQEKARKIAEKKAKMKKEQKGFFADFKKFITRGNVVDMAVGVAVAAAFTAIVTAFTKGFITPILALISGDKSVAELKYIIRPEIVDAEGKVVEAEIALLYGGFIQAILDFLIIAMTLFIVMKVAGAIIKRTNRIMAEVKKITDADAEKEKAEAEAKAKKAAEEKEAAEKAAAEAAAAKAAEDAAKIEQMYKDISEQKAILVRIAEALEKK